MGKAYLNKMTTATLGLVTTEMEAVCKGKPEAVEVARVYGFITGSETGTTSIGDYVKFQGEFEGENLLDGQISRSAALILPAVAEMPLVQLASSAEKGEKVKFGVVLTVSENRSTKPGVKFRWGVKQLIESSAEDELSKLAKSLPAPGTVATKKGRR